MKKLYKDKSNRKISGVCAGLSTYFNLDVTLLRVITTVLILMFTFYGILAYVLLAYLLPDKSEVKSDKDVIDIDYNEL